MNTRKHLILAECARWDGIPDELVRAYLANPPTSYTIRGALDTLHAQNATAGRRDGLDAKGGAK